MCCHISRIKLISKNNFGDYAEGTPSLSDSILYNKAFFAAMAKIDEKESQLSQFEK